MKKILLLIYMLSTTLLYSQTINIAVAANISYAIPQIVKEFNKLYPNTKVNTILGSSGKLTAQIFHNAPYDIFLSANMKYPQTLYKKKFTLNSPKIYAKGSLVLFSSQKRDFTKGLNILLDKNIKTIAIANPKTAPYGLAAKKVLVISKLYDSIKSRLIYGESIGQTLTYSVKVCDIGIISKSSLFHKSMKKYQLNDNYIEIDKNLYKPINQGIVLLKNAKNKIEAKQFYDFIFSTNARKILSKYGYIVYE